MPNSFEKQMTDAFCLDFAFRVTEFKVFRKNKWDISIHLKNKSIIVAPKREDKIANVQIYHAASGTLSESYLLPSLHHIYDTRVLHAGVINITKQLQKLLDHS